MNLNPYHIIYRPSALLRELKQQNLWLNSNRGQNYLCDKNLCKKIVGLLGETQAPVLEIGPGLGALSLQIMEHGNPLEAIEIDGGITKMLGRLLPNLKIINGDALHVPWPYGKIFVSSVPYSIGGALIFRLLREGPYEQVLLILQKEFAERLCGKIPGKHSGRLSVLFQSLYKSKIAFTIPKHLFFPEPKVTSVVVHAHYHDAAISQDTLSTLKEILQISFSQRRKTLRKVFRANPSLQDALKDAGIPETSRPEDLSLNQWVKVSRASGKDCSPPNTSIISQS